MQKLALFDLDNTLLIGDSDHAWGHYLASINAVDAKQQSEAQDNFYKQYQQGKLDIYEFSNFQFTPLKENNLKQLVQWREEYIETHIKPMITQERLDLVKHHQNLEHELIIITATNSFITRPIADLFGIEHLIATEPEQNTNGFTGKIDGTPCFQAGKIKKLNQFLSKHYVPESTISDYESWFYSDSQNDLPLLKEVTRPVAVTPDDSLREYAKQHQWRIID